jgi:copper chaperone CopZ
MTEGVIEQKVTFEEDMAEVLFDPNQITVEELEEVLAGTGYRPKSSRIVDD